jgi:pimeloyl-ACP methyl ester carboxylesterase
MGDGTRRNADDLREAVKLVVEATTGVTTVVEEMHHRIASGPAVLGKPLALPARIITRIAYGNVRGVTRLVGKAIDRVVAELAPLLGESATSAERDVAVAALNGVLGDWLVQTKSPFAVTMRLRHETPGPKVVVLVHGSSMNDRQWAWRGHDHGALLARDHGWSTAYVHYNSGLPIAENGRLLSALLETLEGVDEIAIVGHSMGGLVARMACHAAETEGRAWRKKLTKLVTLGSPHLGAPLERGGHLLSELLPISSYSAPLARLARLRSAGITDMRHGLDVPLPAGVACHAIAAGKDLLVPLASAFGSFPKTRCSIVANASHLDLLDSLEAYETIRGALSSVETSGS